jgi:hypothetical protein
MMHLVLSKLERALQLDLQELVVPQQIHEQLVVKLELLVLIVQLELQQVRQLVLLEPVLVLLLFVVL